MALPQDIHVNHSRTWGPNNTQEQIQSDSQNPPAAAALDQNALRGVLIEAGYTPEAVDASFILRDRLNERYRGD